MSDPRGIRRHPGAPREGVNDDVVRVVEWHVAEAGRVERAKPSPPWRRPSRPSTSRPRGPASCSRWRRSARRCRSAPRWPWSPTSPSARRPPRSSRARARGPPVGGAGRHQEGPRPDRSTARPGPGGLRRPGRRAGRGRRSDCPPSTRSRGRRAAPPGPSAASCSDAGADWDAALAAPTSTRNCTGS